jgi:hypothetical protein
MTGTNLHPGPERVEVRPATWAIPKRCAHCDLLMDTEEAEASDFCGRCSWAETARA